MMKRKYPTYEEKRKQDGFVDIGGRQNTHWHKEIAMKCKHEWQPVTINIGASGQPDLNDDRCYCVFSCI